MDLKSLHEVIVTLRATDGALLLDHVVVSLSSLMVHTQHDSYQVSCDRTAVITVRDEGFCRGTEGWMIIDLEGLSREQAIGMHVAIEALGKMLAFFCEETVFPGSIPLGPSCDQSATPVKLHVRALTQSMFAVYIADLNEVVLTLSLRGTALADRAVVPLDSVLLVPASEGGHPRCERHGHLALRLDAGSGDGP